MPNPILDAQNALDKATEIYLNCDAPNRWKEYREEMEYWERRVKILKKAVGEREEGQLLATTSQILFGGGNHE